MTKPILARQAGSDNTGAEPGATVIGSVDESAPRKLWAAPGGGAEPDELRHATLRRELHEELGYTVDSIGPEIWHRTVQMQFLDGSYDGQHDRYFLIRCPAFDPQPAIGWERLNAEYVVDIRWWTLDQIAASESTFAPRSFSSALAELIRNGPPDTPVDVGR